MTTKSESKRRAPARGEAWRTTLRKTLEQPKAGPNPGMWEQANGEQVAIKDMSDEHLTNALKASIDKQRWGWVEKLAREKRKRQIELIGDDGMGDPQAELAHAMAGALTGKNRAAVVAKLEELITAIKSSV